jgi:hypothetical protein
MRIEAGMDRRLASPDRRGASDRTLLDEHFRIKRRHNSQESANQIQADLDEFLAF